MKMRSAAAGKLPPPKRKGADSVPRFSPRLYLIKVTGVAKNDVDENRYLVAGTLTRDGKISFVTGFNAGLPHALHRGNEVTGKEKHRYD